MTTVLTYIFMALSAVSALGILITRNVLHAALLLVLSLLGVAAVFVLLRAEFIAITQIMIYVGGVLVLIIFGVMLTNKTDGQAVLVKHRKPILGLLLAAVVFATFVKVISGVNWTGMGWMNNSSTISSGNDIPVIGKGILTTYLVPFEVAGILLLVALVGASIIAGKSKTDHS